MTISARVLDFGNSIRGTVIDNGNDDFTIFLNARTSFEMQQETYLHEVEHIMKNDFDKFNVGEIEQNTYRRC